MNGDDEGNIIIDDHRTWKRADKKKRLLYRWNKHGENGFSGMIAVAGISIDSIPLSFRERGYGHRDYTMLLEFILHCLFRKLRDGIDNSGEDMVQSRLIAHLRANFKPDIGYTPTGGTHTASCLYFKFKRHVNSGTML